MTRSELFRAATAKVGRPINPASFQYATLIGEVDRGERLPDGWMKYSERHVKQLVAYKQKRSHRARRQAAQSS